ncbi:hypothetical protein N9D31_02605 [Oligoflexaceae bacterium]|nr:hypothetical protein [Oligoflexaceae bacterium]
MNVVLYHNPNCSKSREALSLLSERGIKPQLREYLKVGVTAAEVIKLAEQAQLSVLELVRTGEDEWPQNSPGEAEAAALIAKTPKLLQRPIVSHEGRALVARPPKLLIAFLGLK